ncbi:hypothetical protein KC349_g5783 [Hortaea werneckii]|nr:hypothetical protein KC349_g5783 [Hortaea werneckii]
MPPKRSSPLADNNVQPYRMHVSQKYLDLTKQKLELARLPREPQGPTMAAQQSAFGVPKSDLEPLIDFWVEDYDWREQEKFYNDSLPQFRGTFNGARIHFVHRRSHSPNAIPLLFVHGFPESFIAVSRMIDALCNPPSGPGHENVPAFHVVCPSIPGFGFSDPIHEEANALPTTASIFDGLMKGLGYRQYITHGSGWAFRICRMLAVGHSDSCLAIHTVNPEVPQPQRGFGYPVDDPLNPSIAPSAPHGILQQFSERPQTLSYALCDSPPGLLAYMLDAIRPAPFSGSPHRSHSAESISNHSSPVASRPSYSPQSSVVGTPGPGRSPQARRSPPKLSPYTSKTSSPSTPQAMQLPDVHNPWSPIAIINWTMIYWLPGPEVALRWLANSAALVPSLWMGQSNVPLGISHFRESVPGSGTGQTPPQWLEAYHRVAMVRRREGRVRYPAWERPADLVMDIRELAGIVTSVPAGSVGNMDMFSPMGPIVPSAVGPVFLQ